MMSRLDYVKCSSLAVYPLSSPTSRKSLSVFSQLLSSCIGPNGKNHVVRNACGGHMTITSNCARLLSTISLSRSELKLVASAISGHLNQCGDGGLFMAHMCLELTKSALDLRICHSTVSSAFSLFVSIIVDYLKTKDNDIMMKADFSNVNVLLAYVGSIIRSKSLLNIQPHQIKELSLIVLNAFVKAIPSTPIQRLSNGIFVTGYEKQPISSCRVIDGIMLEFSEYSTFGKLIDLTSLLQSKLCEIDGVLFWKVALITCSLSGDVEDIVDVTFEGTKQQFSEMDEHVFLQMLTLCNVLEIEGVAMVLCQKVIHPRLKVLLKSKGIIFLDRLGLLPVCFIRDLTGCQPITSVICNVQVIQRYLGKLTSIAPCKENGKTYICLQNRGSIANVVTLVICAEWEERLSELKQCVNTCLKGLELFAREPWLLMGGGCWQLHCSHILQEKVLSSLQQMSLKLSCSDSTLRQLLVIFVSCLRRWGIYLKLPQEHLYFDSSSGHCWAVSNDLISSSLNDKLIKRCCCGVRSKSVDSLQELEIILDMPMEIKSISSNNTKQWKFASPVLNNEMTSENNDFVLDNYTVCMEALHKGVLTAGLLLSVGLLICDGN